MPNIRPFYCDKCEAPLDKHDFYEMALTHRVITMRDREFRGRVFEEKYQKSHRTVPGVRLCEACAQAEGDRMRLLFDGGAA